MTATDLHFYLPSPLREDSAAGAVNIATRIAAAVAPFGWRAQWHGDSPAERARALGPGYHLFHMQEPVGPRCLTLRRAYAYPFWQIEATNERWNFDVAKSAFDPTGVDMATARPFFRRMGRKLLGEGDATSEGFIFMPLQGRLREQRSFQALSPEAMIAATLDHLPGRQIRATLHPRETYDAADLAMLDGIAARFPRFRVIRADARDALRACDLVVTQNSSVALSGYFARKRAVLFAGADFHHIAGSVPRDGLATAFAGREGRVPFVAYAGWFFGSCINAGAPDASAMILARLRRHGWPL
ncbi:hypothetical protein [Szabonella alba]|uniref:Capsule polysaccharide biosynthesis protein n=1 Tax=Szabonella alba TaxID=2804194 RepID=A0A8K0V7A8_9RHOB|nr:hypothetical protein [Szabonella alba]MBL4916688.1 hypothetical protein [Szabonella alba]